MVEPLPWQLVPREICLEEKSGVSSYNWCNVTWSQLDRVDIPFDFNKQRFAFCDGPKMILFPNSPSKMIFSPSCIAQIFTPGGHCFLYRPPFCKHFTLNFSFFLLISLFLFFSLLIFPFFYSSPYYISHIHITLENKINPLSNLCWNIYIRDDKPVPSSGLPRPGWPSAHTNNQVCWLAMIGGLWLINYYWWIMIFV